MVSIHPGLVIVTHYKDLKSLLWELLPLFLTLLASRVTLPSELLQQDENLPATQITQQAKCRSRRTFYVFFLGKELISYVTTDKSPHFSKPVSSTIKWRSEHLSRKAVVMIQTGHCGQGDLISVNILTTQSLLIPPQLSNTLVPYYKVPSFWSVD